MSLTYLLAVAVVSWRLLVAGRFVAVTLWFLVSLWSVGSSCSAPHTSAAASVAACASAAVAAPTASDTSQPPAAVAGTTAARTSPARTAGCFHCAGWTPGRIQLRKSACFAQRRPVCCLKLEALVSCPGGLGWLGVSAVNLLKIFLKII